MTTPDVTVTVTRYTVHVLPERHPDHRHYALHVELKPDGWVVGDGHRYYRTDGSFREAQGMAHRFADHDDALNVAREAAPEWTVNGRTAAEVLARSQGAS